MARHCPACELGGPADTLQGPGSSRRNSQVLHLLANLLPSGIVKTAPNLSKEVSWGSDCEDSGCRGTVIQRDVAGTEHLSLTAGHGVRGFSFLSQEGETDDWLVAMGLLEWKKYNLSSGPNKKGSVWKYNLKFPSLFKRSDGIWRISRCGFPGGKGVAQVVESALAWCWGI